MPAKKSSDDDGLNPEELSQKQIELAMANLNRQFGQGSIIRLSSEPQQWPAISTGAMTLDLALGIGGLPRGRIVEIWGKEGSGKSSICLTVVANAQAMGERCLYVDVEHAIDPLYAESLGVNLGELLFAQPATGEEAIDVVETMVRTGGMSVVVVDSVAALVPRAELEGDMSTQHMGLQPRLMSKAMRKLTGIAAETKTLVIFVNQVREKVGIVYGNPITQPGGHALKFAASVRMELSKKEELKTPDGKMYGLKVQAKVLKNKMAPPLKTAMFDIEYGKGINKLGCILDMAVEIGVCDKGGGGYYSFGEMKLGQGRERVLEYLLLEPTLVEKIKQEIMTSVGHYGG